MVDETLAFNREQNPNARYPGQGSLEQRRIQTSLLDLGVRIHQQKGLSRGADGQLEICCIYSGKTEIIQCQSLITVTERIPQRNLYDPLMARQAQGEAPEVKTIRLIGDALAPGTIAAAVYSGHRYAREFASDIDIDRPPFKREMPWYLDQG